MIDAETARQMMNDSTVDRVNGELSRIEAEIKSAILKGEHFIWFYDRVCPQTKDKLRELGYGVEEYDNQHDGYSLKIRW